MEVGGENRYAPSHFVNGWGYWGGANQQWQFRDIGNGQYKITNRNSRQFLRIGGSNQANVAVQVFQDNSGSVGDYAQRWNLVPSSAGGYKLMNGYTGHVLKETYDVTTVYTCCGVRRDNYYVEDLPRNDNAQDFDFMDVSAATPGVFRIINYNSDKALSAEDDNTVKQLPMWYLASQEWTFSDYNADGYLSIINRNTNQVLEIGGGSGNWGQPGARANVWDGYGNPWQQWRLVSTDGNNTPLTVQQIFTTGITCKLLNRYSGLVLEIGGNGDLTEYGRAANQWYDWNGPNQQWYIYLDSSYRGTVKSGDAAAADPASGTLALYPNPASTTLQIILPGNSEALQVTVTDAQGRTTQMSHHQGKVDVSNLAPGLYIVSVADGQKTLRQKFVKE